ncbi:Flp family type IVb pilin [Geoalkalibacter halelectricus]|uniref:Flp family type IVb pilin n=1 Tax=Geoalkalibacter halelectricus TaxID=2847045 RepID=A0ABY5ZQV6_9BACT|nr:Flp family type IVb pilin [Geoalkalibacter halelectricus]MDO3378425.1 Flp family type IVb pilin [Geoalkalibacter halelectricus]UWZ80255.1 Flp family type IVb pilin [Geoalkalibacter halelectricus]
MLEKMKNLWKDEEGATAVEYGVMIALISAALIGTIVLIGGKLLAAFETVEAALP